MNNIIDVRRKKVTLDTLQNEYDKLGGNVVEIIMNEKQFKQYLKFFFPLSADEVERVKEAKKDSQPLRKKQTFYRGIPIKIESNE